MSKPIIAWIDLETTGINHLQNGIIQIAGMIEKDNEIVEKFDFRVRPFDDDVIEQGALDVNNITREQIAEFPTAKEVYSQLNSIFNKYVDKYDKKDKMIFAGYNARFDFDFLLEFYKKNGNKFFLSLFWFPVLDVCPLVLDKHMEERRNMTSFKLGTVAEFVGVDMSKYENLHDALVDIEVTREIYKTL